MAIRTYTNRDGELRLYDATGTPFYLSLPFINGNFACPWGRGRPDEVAVMNRGRIRNTDSNWHYVTGPDDPIVAPMQLTFTIRIANIDPTRQKLRAAMNVDVKSTFTVGLNTWVTTKGTSAIPGSVIANILVTTPAFADPMKRTVDVQFILTDPDSTGTNHIGYRYRECYFPPDQQKFTESGDQVDVSVVAMCYGAVSEITAFTAGTAG